MKINLFLFLMLALPLIGISQPCSFLAYEGFSYNSSTALNNLYDGSGWGSDWDVQGNNSTVPGYHVQNANPLVFNGLQTLGNYLTGGSVYLTAGRLLDVSASSPFSDYIQNGSIGVPDSTLWFSVLLRKDAANGSSLSVDLHNQNITWYVTTPRVGCGFYGTPSTVGGTQYWSLRMNDSIYTTSEPVVVGQAVFMVLKIEFFNGSHTVSLFVNPTTLGSATPSPDLVRTRNYAFSFRSLATYLGSSAGNGSIDEIRLATSYECVAPDATTAVDNPPIANFTATATDGNAPLFVAFDGNTSSDDNGITSYSWNFGDGNQTTGVTTTHTFTALGVHLVRLQVTDAAGATHTRQMNITVRDAQGNYPCNARLSMQAMATCGNADGAFTVTAGDAQTIELRDGAQNLIAPTSGTTFSNLAAGNYELTLSNANGCYKHYDLQIPVDSTTCGGYTNDDCQMKFGMGLGGVNYWGRERAFKNIFKASGYLITYNSTGANTWDTQVAAELQTDADGYPLQIPHPTSIGNQNVRIMISATGSVPIGNYVLLYDGVGTIQFYGGTVNSSVPNRMEITVNSTGNTWIQITASQLGNHVRNIRIVRPEHETNYDTQPFYEEFLNALQPFTTIRFMDWQLTNASTNEHWADRTTPTYYTQAVSNGVAYEYIAQLCNTLQKDAWICVPHRATDDYLQQMASFFQQHLDTNLNIYLEYSNEVWNWQFEQAQWNNNTKPDNLTYPRAYAQRAIHAFEIWHQIYGNRRHRVKRVLATQLAYTWVGEEILSHAGSETFDYFSPTWYFGYSGASCGLNASSTATDVLTCSRDYFRQSFHLFKTNNRNAALHGKRMIYYEGGQHMTSNPVIEPFQQAVYDAQIQPMMYDVYQEVIDSIRLLNSDLAVAFVLAAIRESRYGSWGHLEFITQDLNAMPAPKYEVLLDNINLCNVILPVQLTEFETVCVAQGAELRWATASEINTANFEIQRRSETSDWQTIAYQTAVGNTFEPQFYTFLDKDGGEGTVYYRLKINDFDESYEFSGINAVRCSAADYEAVTIRPNPAHTETVVITCPNCSQGNLSIFDTHGRLIQTFADANAQHFELSIENLAAGVYFIHFQNEEQRWVKRLVKM